MNDLDLFRMMLIKANIAGMDLGIHDDYTTIKIEAGYPGFYTEVKFEKKTGKLLSIEAHK